MTIFSTNTVDERNGFDWLRQLLFPGVLGSSMGLTMEFFGLLRLDPKEAFELLRVWGPNFLIGLVIVVIVGGLLSQMIDISRDGVSVQRQMAEAISQIAQRDDRQLQEIQTLSAYTAQQSERLYRRHDRIERALQSIAIRMRIPQSEMEVEEKPGE